MKTVTTEIRLARQSDAPIVAEVHDEAWRAAYRGLIPGAELEKLISRRGPNWWDAAIRKGNRIALANIRERLLLHFDLDAQLKSEPLGAVYQVNIVIPYTHHPRNRG